MSQPRKCGWCLQGFDFEPRPQADVETYRKVLLIADDGYEPIICDKCYKIAMQGSQLLIAA